MEFRGIPQPSTRIRALVGIVAVICVCQSALSAPPPSDVEAIAALLETAEEAFTAGHFIYPARGSAMALYHEVLVIAPGNPDARRGLERLVDHYLGEATAAIAEERFIRAEGALSRARMIDRDNPNIEPIAAELRLLENADRIRVTLDWRLVAERSSELSPTLIRLGEKARRSGCRAMLSVGSDAEGRWLYQQLSRAPGERRIQAQIRIASPSAVEVLCFEAGE